MLPKPKDPKKNTLFATRNIKHYVQVGWNKIFLEDLFGFGIKGIVLAVFSLYFPIAFLVLSRYIPSS